jgi:RNA polymerase sigma-70 factor (ECF subfamily)
VNSPEHQSEVLRLLLEHRDSLFAYIFAIVRDFHVAEDLFQEASVAVCESAADFHLGTSFGAWAREIARRRVLAWFRRTRRADELLEALSPQLLQEAFERAEADAPGQERIDALRRCLAGMSPWLQQIIQLRFAAQMSLEQIARHLERQPESIRKALYRGRQLLRECIERRLRTSLDNP